MGAPTQSPYSQVPVIDGLNFNPSRARPANVTVQDTGPSINKILGLRKSPYKGLRQVGKQDLYYGKGGLYEPYTPTPVQYGRQTIFGFQPMSIGGISTSGGRAAGTIRIGDQAFKPYSGDKTPRGFVKTDGGYDISMAYIDSKTPKYQGTPQKSLIPAIDAILSTPSTMQGGYGAGRFITNQPSQSQSMYGNDMTNASQGNYNPARMSAALGQMAQGGGK